MNKGLKPNLILVVLLLLNLYTKERRCEGTLGAHLEALTEKKVKVKEIKRASHGHKSLLQAKEGMD